jgi:hypothetical protein
MAVVLGSLQIINHGQCQGKGGSSAPWLRSHRSRPLAIRYKRRAGLYEAFLHLGCIPVGWNFIPRKGFC